MGNLKKPTLGALAAVPFDPSGAALVLAVGSGIPLITRSTWRKVTGSSDGPETVGKLVSDLYESTSFNFYTVAKFPLTSCTLLNLVSNPSWE